MKKIFALLALLCGMIVPSGCDHADRAKYKIANTLSCGKNNDELKRRDVPTVASSKPCMDEAINKENESYNKMRKEQKNLHDRIRHDMKWDRQHNTWHENYPIGEVVPVTPPVAPPADIITTGPTPAPDVTPAPVNPVVNPNTGPPITGNKKAVIVGINKYPGAPLNGCVNDAMNIRAFLMTTVSDSDKSDYANWVRQALSFKDEEIVILLDSDATTEKINAALLWLVADSKAGDVRYFWYSGHGAEYAGNDVKNQPDHQNQVICPVDFDWSPEHMIMDVQFYKMFGTFPVGIIFCWGSDSCHSGDLTRAILVKGALIRHYPIAPPANVAANLAAVKRTRGMTRRGIVAGELEVGFLSGCNYDEYSNDTVDSNGVPCGAFTNQFLLYFRQADAWRAPLTTVSSKINIVLDSMNYGQHVQAEGFNKNKGWGQR